MALLGKNIFYVSQWDLCGDVSVKWEAVDYVTMTVQDFLEINIMNDIWVLQRIITSDNNFCAFTALFYNFRYCYVDYHNLNPWRLKWLFLWFSGSKLETSHFTWISYGRVRTRQQEADVYTALHISNSAIVYLLVDVPFGLIQQADSRLTMSDFVQLKLTLF